MTTSAAPGVPTQVAGAGVPAARPPGGAPAAKPAPKRSGGLRRLIVPVLLIAALGYGGKMAYDYFVEGRFLVCDRRRLCRHLDRDHRREGHGAPDRGSGGRQPGRPSGRSSGVDRRRRLQERGRRHPGANRHPGRDHRSLRPPDRRAGRGHFPGRGADRGLAGAIKGLAGGHRARCARIRALAEARPIELRLATAARTGDRRPRPHRRRAARLQGGSRLGRGRVGRRQGQSRRLESAARRGDAPARRTGDRSRKG